MTGETLLTITNSWENKCLTNCFILRKRSCNRLVSWGHHVLRGLFAINSTLQLLSCFQFLIRTLPPSVSDGNWSENRLNNETADEIKERKVLPGHSFGTVVWTTGVQCFPALSVIPEYKNPELKASLLHHLVFLLTSNQNWKDPDWCTLLPCVLWSFHTLCFHSSDEISGKEKKPRLCWL